MTLQSALAMFYLAIPRIAAFLAVLIAGWWLARLIGNATGSLLRRAKFNDVAWRSGINDVMHKGGITMDASGAVGGIVRWCLRAVVVVIALGFLGISALNAVAAQFLLWLPSAFVALAVLVLGSLAASAAGKLVFGAASRAGMPNASILMTVTRAIVLGFAVVVALNQLNVATIVVNTLLIGVVGAAALAAGLAFGLGGQERARELIETWHAHARDFRPAMQRARKREAEQFGPTVVYGQPPAGHSWVQRVGGDRRVIAMSGHGNGDSHERRRGFERREYAL